jgi:hypothetical protein
VREILYCIRSEIYRAVFDFAEAALGRAGSRRKVALRQPLAFPFCTYPPTYSCPKAFFRAHVGSGPRFA